MDILTKLNESRLLIKKLSEDAEIPTRGSEYSAGLDLYSVHEETIDPQTSKAIHTHVAMSIPKGFVGLIYARSGLATKRNLRPANCVGVIDSDYRGEIIVPLYNDSQEVQHIDYHERVAQMIITPYANPEILEVNTLDETDRGEGGFGSTGRL